MNVTKFSTVKITIVIFLMLITQQIYAVSDIEGIWKHSEKQAWLNIDAVAGVVTVYVHHQANSAGLTVIKDVKPNSMSRTVWVGKMYAATSDSFVDVELLLQTPDCISIMHNSIEVLRLYRDDLSK